MLDAAGVDPVTAEELTVLPGAEEVLALLELRLQVLTGDWDVVVVDCAPTAETLRLLALPEALAWYMDRVFPVERRVVRALRPVLSRAAGVPMPEDGVFDAVERLHDELDEVRALLTGPRVVGAAGADAGDRRPRRGPPLAHHALAVRLPRRRRRGQPGLPRRRCGRLARRLGRRPGRGARPRCSSPSPSCRCGARPTATTSRSAGESLTALAEELYAGADPLADPAAHEPLRFAREGRVATLRLALPVRRALRRST